MRSCLTESICDRQEIWNDLFDFISCLCTCVFELFMLSAESQSLKNKGSVPPHSNTPEYGRFEFESFLLVSDRHAVCISENFQTHHGATWLQKLYLKIVCADKRKGNGKGRRVACNATDNDLETGIHKTQNRKKENEISTKREPRQKLNLRERVSLVKLMRVDISFIHSYN